MIAEPPGDPTLITNAPLARSKTSIGDIDDRGRLPPSTRFATGTPFSFGTNEKSVSSLLSRKPRTMICEPNTFSIVVVIAIALPKPSTTEMCEVDASSRLRSSARLSDCVAGTPGCAWPMLRSPISAARCCR